jgi:hypothetical protein
MRPAKNRKRAAARVTNTAAEPPKPSKRNLSSPFPTFVVPARAKPITLEASLEAEDELWNLKPNEHLRVGSGDL